MKLVVDISGHGLGHAGQLIPVLRRLKEDVPRLSLVLRTWVPDRIFRERLGFAYERDAPPADVTLHMRGPTEPDIAASIAAYEALHGNWAEAVEHEARRLAPLKADLLLSDVAYTSLAAAQRLGLKAAALSSLNWLDVFEVYCTAAPNFAAIRQQMLEAYDGAALFIQATPHTPMAALGNRRPVGPIAERGRTVRAALDQRLGLGPGDKLVTVNFGGIPGLFPIADVPTIPGIRWIVPEGLTPARPDVALFEALGIPLIDLVTSSDAVVAKPGYGLFAETIGAGIRLLYTDRPLWPETPCLTGWACTAGAAAALGAGDRDMARFARALTALLSRPVPAPPPLTGTAEAARLIAAL